MTRKQLGAFLRERGYPVSDSVLNKLCAPAVNDGPPVAGWWGHRPLYDPEDASEWAERRVRPSRRNSTKNTSLAEIHHDR
jgi:hypothetical protein